MKVRLHIDRLVLDGFDLPPLSRGELRAALERELAHLIAAGGLAPALAQRVSLPSVGAPQINAPLAGGDGAQLGTAIAKSLYGGLGGGER
jgi:hypothetical protein